MARIDEFEIYPDFDGIDRSFISAIGTYLCVVCGADTGLKADDLSLSVAHLCRDCGGPQ